MTTRRRDDDGNPAHLSPGEEPPLAAPLTAQEDMSMYRPICHFTPSEGWMNDPNGLVWFDGEYHLFYQHRTPRCWGHAVSRDLLHWEHLPIALEPDALGQIYSGSAVVDETDSSGLFSGGAGLVAVFTHHHNSGRQRQSIAFSSDRGRTWIRYTGNPVLADVEGDFRDPKVLWHAPTSSWRMVVAAGPALRCYRSPNLRDWTYVSNIWMHPGRCWECPDLFPLTQDGRERWVLVASWFVRGASSPVSKGVSYLVGSFDGDQFVAETPERPVSVGFDDYAPVVWSNAPDGRVVMLGWMNCWDYARVLPTRAEGWQGAMTLPRVLALRDLDGLTTMVQQPAVEPCRAVAASSSEAGLLDLRLRRPHPTAAAWGARVTSGSEELATVTVTNDDQLTIVRLPCTAVPDGTPFEGVRTARIEGGATIEELRVIVDRCSFEVFVNDGALYAATLVFPVEGKPIVVEALTDTEAEMRLKRREADVPFGEGF